MPLPIGNAPVQVTTSSDIVEKLGNTVSFHLPGLKTDAGAKIEHTYDALDRLIKTATKSPGYRLEIRFDPVSGKRLQVRETAFLPDGNQIESDTLHHSQSASSQTVAITRPNGQLLRLTERHQKQGLTTFQSQTDYDPGGFPRLTINQHMEPGTGLLMHREEVTWVDERYRSMTEHRYFNHAGYTIRYIKILYYLALGPFSEETQEFDPASRFPIRHQLKAFAPDGRQISQDLLTFAADGTVQEYRRY